MKSEDAEQGHCSFCVALPAPKRHDRLALLFFAPKNIVSFQGILLHLAKFAPYEYHKITHINIYHLPNFNYDHTQILLPESLIIKNRYLTQSIMYKKLSIQKKKGPVK